jgi:alkanesulfonate monooxygenase SsuD/methylene tetrahydromethanopterin reductase-like flavin-dependent oxidoreductase (luciferase family)
MSDDASLTPQGTHPWIAEAQHRIRFGVSIFPQPVDWRHFVALVRRMEEQGFDAYLAYDHPTARADCWTALTALAMGTERIRLGTIVDCIYYRPPYLLARQAADVDRLSNGRLVLGLGIGDVPDEFAAMGIPYPPASVRQQGMEETIRIVRGLWSGQPFEFTGEQWSVKTDGSFLGPVQEPYVPILLAGGGEKVTLRQVARYADASNMGAHATIGRAVTLTDVARKFGKLREYCDEIGRSYDSILRSHFTMPPFLAETHAALDRKLARIPPEKLASWGPAVFAGTPDEAIAFYRRLVDAGFQYFILNILDGDEETLELFATAVLPAFA